MNIESAILDLAKDAEKIVITSHKSPDGDSIGSSLGLYFFLEKLGLTSSICHPDPAPKYLQWLDENKLIINFEEHTEEVKEKLAEADLIFSLDYNEPFRLGQEMGQCLVDAKAKKVMIDHHLFPSDFCDLTLSDTNTCSTSQLICQLIKTTGNESLLNTQIATPLYLGIMTDTGSFRFNSVKPATHRYIADLLETGIKHDEIHERIFDVNTPEKLKLRGFAIAEKLEVLEQYQTALISLSEEELNQFTHEKGDTEGLVNIALSIEGIKIAAFFSEKDGEVKISFRSKGNKHPINGLASTYFNGGGHANAAGGKVEGTLADAISKFKTVLPEYVA